MDNTIKRDSYLQKLIEKKENGLIRITSPHKYERNGWYQYSY